MAGASPASDRATVSDRSGLGTHGTAVGTRVVAAGTPQVALGSLRIALGVVFFFFGALKFFPDLSPAEMLATQTIMRLSWHWLDAHTALRALAVFECLIGLGFLLDVAPRWLAPAFFVHMLGTALPLFLMPEFCFKIAPFAPTLEGQYILKNLVLVAAGWVVLAPGLAASGRYDEGARRAEAEARQ